MSSQFHVPQSRAEADPRRWVALAVLLLANFMNLMDVTIVNVALPSLRENLNADASQIEWVIAAYVLAFALGLLPFGRLGDIIGRTHMFLWGVAAFALHRERAFPAWLTATAAASVVISTVGLVIDLAGDGVVPAGLDLGGFLLANVWIVGLSATVLLRSRSRSGAAQSSYNSGSRSPA